MIVHGVVVETASYRNTGKDCIPKIQSDQAFLCTLSKQELHAPDFPF
jgi:hypothetical protein